MLETTRILVILIKMFKKIILSVNSNDQARTLSTLTQLSFLKRENLHRNKIGRKLTMTSSRKKNRKMNSKKSRKMNRKKSRKMNRKKNRKKSKKKNRKKTRKIKR